MNMNMNRKLITTFLIVFLIGFISYFLINKGGQENFNTNKENAAIDDMADWKTYKNEECKYEIKYPPDWVIEINHLIIPEDNGIQIMPKGFENDKRDMRIAIDPVNVGTDSPFDYVDNPEKISGSFKDVVFANKQAKEYHCGPPCLSVLYYSKAIHIGDIEGINWGQWNQISYRIRTEDYKYLMPIYDKILSTLKFTN